MIARVNAGEYLVSLTGDDGATRAYNKRYFDVITFSAYFKCTTNVKNTRELTLHKVYEGKLEAMGVRIINDLGNEYRYSAARFEPVTARDIKGTLKKDFK
jgi:hypothetical protein